MSSSGGGATPGCRVMATPRLGSFYSQLRHEQLWRRCDAGLQSDGHAAVGCDMSSSGGGATPGCRVMATPRLGSFYSQLRHEQLWRRCDAGLQSDGHAAVGFIL
ncbi:hypothetical protein ACJJTC_009164 [Scirpophaga incertulas]